MSLWCLQFYEWFSDLLGDISFEEILLNRRAVKIAEDLIHFLQGVMA